MLFIPNLGKLLIKLLQSYSGLISFPSQTQFLAWRDKQEYLYLFNTNHYWKRLWCWEGLGAGGEGDDQGWDGWMASSTRWTWVWVNSRSWWWTRRPGMLWFMGSQRVRHDWEFELNWIIIISVPLFIFSLIHIFSIVFPYDQNLGTDEWSYLDP